MTAEVAVLNKMAVALAADSAVTVEQIHKRKIERKVYYSANKLFSLSKFKPVGVMVYNTMTLGGVPFEPLIKSFREYLHENSKAHVGGYVEEFFSFLSSTPWLFATERERRIITFVIMRQLIALAAKHSTNQQIKDALDREITRLEKIEDVPGFDAEFIAELPRLYEREVELATNAALAPAQNRNTHTRIKRFVQLTLTKKERIPNYSGMVFAGYGEEDIFPSLSELNVDLVVAGRVRRWSLQEARTSEEERSFVIPFADKAVIQTVMDGINPGFFRHLFREAAKVIASLPKEMIGRITAKHREMNTSRKPRVQR